MFANSIPLKKYRFFKNFAVGISGNQHLSSQLQGTGSDELVLFNDTLKSLHSLRAAGEKSGLTTA